MTLFSNSVKDITLKLNPAGSFPNDPISAIDRNRIDFYNNNVYPKAYLCIVCSSLVWYYINMARAWTNKEKKLKRDELYNLYTVQNKTISDIGEILKICQTTVYERLVKLNIKIRPDLKPNYLNKKIVSLPHKSALTAELIGIMLGDGHISKRNGQLYVCCNSETDLEYSYFLKDLFYKLTGKSASSFCRTNQKALDVFFTSVDFLKHMENLGLISTNKVKQQVQIPSWVKEKCEWTYPCIRGLFDTDGSLYRLKFGFQWEFTNHSLALLNDTRDLLLIHDFHPSRISCFNIYLTRKNDLRRYFTEIGSNNPKHLNKAKIFGII